MEKWWYTGQAKFGKTGSRICLRLERMRPMSDDGGFGFGFRCGWYEMGGHYQWEGGPDQDIQVFYNDATATICVYFLFWKLELFRCTITPVKEGK